MTFPFSSNQNMPMMGQPGFNFFNKVPMAPPLYIGELDESIYDEVLYDFFSKFGPIHFVRIMRDPSTGKSRGFGFVNFIYPRDAESARQFAQYEKIGRKYIRIMFKRNVRDLPPEANIYVKNLDPHVTVKDLHNHFSQVGPVLCCKVSTNSEGESLGYGYVQFEKKEDAETALETLKNSRLKETELQLIPFLPKDRRGPTASRRNVYIKNLPTDKSEEEVNKIVDETFSKYGEIETKFVKKHPTDSKYSAFVCFKDEEAAQKAFHDITENPKTLPGAEGPLYVNWHQSRSERDRELKRLYSQAHNETNLFVKNLKAEVTENDLKEAFQQFGKIVSIAVKTWNQGEKTAKFGFIAFDNAVDAKKCQLEAAYSPEVRDLYIQGAQPYINFHQAREKRNEFLYTQRRRKMQPGMMNMNSMRGMPFPFANRRFQPFPPLMNSGFRQGGQRGGKPFTRGGPQVQRGGPRHQGQRRGGPNYVKKTDRGDVQAQPTVQAQPNLGTTTGQTTLTVQNLRTKLQEFLLLDIDRQRQILGELLFPLIRDRAGEQIAPKITGMLIDLSVLEVPEILEFLENPELLDERVNEAKTLILEEDL